MKTLADIFGVKIEKDMVKKRPMRVEDIDCSSRLEKYFKEHNSKVKHGNNKMREQFEKLPEIEQGLRHCHYDESTNIYHADAAHVEEFEWHTQFVNGAWYAFQEQQKKLDKAKKEISDFFDNQTMTPSPREYANKLADLLEILK